MNFLKKYKLKVKKAAIIKYNKEYNLLFLNEEILPLLNKEALAEDTKLNINEHLSNWP